MEKALLVVPHNSRKDEWDIEDTRSELKSLVISVGVEVLDLMVCPLREINSSYYIGKGKANEISERAKALDAGVVIFNCELSPAQQRGLEDILEAKVIDRTQLILDVFARRAKSNEGKIQVELAQLNYLLPRLTGKGIELSRLGGGIGTRGPGEQKLEIDRRRIKEKISRLKSGLDVLRERRDNLRIQRRRHSLPLISLVGYTNAGKSSLLNALTKSDVEVDNRLFSTLDAVTRKLSLPNNQDVLLTDTVGFLHNLPHGLIESFKATLEEVEGADLLIHVIDISTHLLDEKFKSVNRVLQELGTDQKPVINVLNKTDQASSKKFIKRMSDEFPDSAALSCLTGEGLDNLRDLIMKKLDYLNTTIKLFIPFSRMDIVSEISANGDIFEKEFTEKGVNVSARLPKIIADKLKNKLTEK
ncbi:MAG: GTPase HflX [bacterium]|nr:GTPase HflX [bacterium]